MNDTMVKSKPVLLFFLLFLWCLIVHSSLVSADELVPTLTKVYVEKNGEPVNDTVKITMNCYGHTCKWYDCGYTCRQHGCGDPETAPSPGTYIPEIVFSFSATCSGYGCPIYEPYYLNYRQIEYCTLSGESGTSPFLIQNFSVTPIPDCTDFHQFDIYGDDYYRVTPEYFTCVNEARTDNDICDKYLEPITKEQEQNLSRLKGLIQTRVINGTIYNETRSFRDCLSSYDAKERACDRYLRKINRSDIIFDNVTGSPIGRICNLRINLSATTGTSNESLISPDRAEGSSNGFFCFLKKIFGAAC